MIREQITKRGQPFYDEPIYAHPKETPISLSISAMFNRGRPVRQRPILLRHERVKLNWITKKG